VQGQPPTRSFTFNKDTLYTVHVVKVYSVQCTVYVFCTTLQYMLQ